MSRDCAIVWLSPLGQMVRGIEDAQDRCGTGGRTAGATLPGECLRRELGNMWRIVAECVQLVKGGVWGEIPIASGGERGELEAL
jgi:hypothetical protein